MKKKNLKSLKLNKKAVSNFSSYQNIGGASGMDSILVFCTLVPSVDIKHTCYLSCTGGVNC